MLDNNLVEKEEYEVNIYANIERNLRSYSGFVSLLRELIQNSDDSSTDGKDVEIEVYFSKEKLVLKNNTSFNDKDWKKIKEIGSRNKEGTSNKTGRFGIGFTSVFKICDKAEIHSKNVSRIVDLNEKTAQKWGKYPTPRYAFEDVTEFEFYWRFEDSFARREIGADIITLEKIDDFIEEVLNNIQYDLHFLNHITKLDIYRDDKLIHKIRIEKTSYTLSKNISKDVKIIAVNGIKNRKLIYHKKLDEHFVEEFEKEIARRKPFLLSVAVDDSNIQNGRAFCTLPTELDTRFAFDINCDFQPDQNRKQLIFDEDDSKGQYNLKILNFLPELLYEILDDLKAETSVELLYEILSSLELGGKFDELFYEFIGLIKEKDCDIVYINNRWYPISESKILNNKSILNFLTRIKYPIISEAYLKYYTFFEEIGVDDFILDDLIDLIQEKIPQSLPFNESIFESKYELYSIYSFINLNFDSFYNCYKVELKNLNIFLTKNNWLKNNRNSSIMELPEKLDLLKDDLPLNQIDKNLMKKFEITLRKLDINNFKDSDLIQILINDFSNISYPINLSESKSYINTKEKLCLIISFVEGCFNEYKEYEKAKNEGFMFINGELVNLHDKKFKKFKNKVQNILQLPFVLTNNYELYSLENNVVYTFNSKLESKFADLIGFKKLDSDIKKMLYRLDLVPSLKLDIIIECFASYLNTEETVSDDSLFLIYQLISEKKMQLNKENIDNIKRIPIFRNNKLELCSLDNNGMEMMLQGNYPIPEGIQVDDILDDSLLDNVPGYPNFKKEIIESKLGVKNLNFERFIRNYFIDIFNNDSIKTKDKIKLFKKVNAEYQNFMYKSSFIEIKNILLNSKLIYCNDGKFHCPSEEPIFFKSKEIEELFGTNYLYPDFEEISKHTYLFEEMGIRKNLDAGIIVEHIVKLIESSKLNKNLIGEMKKIFVYINKYWNSFDENELNLFKELSGLEWLPAVGFSSKLYKPSALHLKNTKPFLSEFNDILYFDIQNSSTIKKDFKNILGLNDTQKIRTEIIIENLQLLSKSNKLIEKPSAIYSELDERVKIDPYSIENLKEFNSIYIKYDDETNPRYFSTSDVFRGDHKKLYGCEYVGYLPFGFVNYYENLIQNLNILDEPDAIAIKNILKKIEFKYKENGYQISNDDDKKIIYNCLKQLDNNCDSSEFDDSVVFELQNMHILYNNKGQLITPANAILDDNHRFSNQFEKILGERFVRYSTDYLNLINKLKIRKITRSVNKELIEMPLRQNLRLNEKYTSKIKHFIQLIPRIKIANQDSTIDDDEWRDFHPDLKVYDVDDLQVLKYISVDGIRYSINENDASCYIKKDKSLMYEIYLKGSDFEVLNGLTNELFETLHPILNRNFISTINALLKLNSYEEMNHFLTDTLGYPILKSTENTTLDIRKHVEDEANGYEDIVDEDENNINDKEELATTFYPNEDLPLSNSESSEYENNINDEEEPATTFYPNENLPLSNSESNEYENNINDKEEPVTTLYPNEDLPLSNSESSEYENNINDEEEPATTFYPNENLPLSNSESNEYEEGSSIHTESLDGNKPSNIGRNELYGSGLKKSKKKHKEKPLSSHKDKGRIKTPDEDMGFKDAIEKEYRGSKGKKIVYDDAIDEDLEPMSLEEKESYTKIINSEIDEEIRNIKYDNSKREDRQYLERLKVDPISKREIKAFYRGKCQICGYTFTTKKGDNYCITCNLLENKKRGVRHPANYLCLCPNHHALLKYGTVEFEDLDHIKNNKLKFTDGNSGCEINYHPYHFMMLKALLNRKKNR